MACISVMSLLSLFAMSLISSCATTDNKTNQPSYKMQPPPLYYGIPGKSGCPGAPGRDGRDGRDGAKGEQGSPGKTGLQGPPGTPCINGNYGVKGEPGVQGPPGQQGQRGDNGTNGTPGINGKNGAKGEPGTQGPPGQKGQRVENGTSGIPGSPSGMSYKNWKECVWKGFNDDKDNGIIKDCVFIKKEYGTSLHVRWTGALRITRCNDCCKRWYVTFNGAECAAPMPIDGIVYMGKASSQNIHRVSNIEGHCNNIHKGKVRVGFWASNCAGYKGSYDASTGWNSVSRIFIEEVPKPQA